MNAQFLSPGEKKRLLAQLKENFGIEKPGVMFIETGKEKIRAFTGSMTREELMEFGRLAHIEIVGLYVAREEETFLRLSVDGVHLFRKLVTKGVFELNAQQAQDWMQGSPLAINLKRGTYIMSHAGDLLGCGYSTGSKVYNYVPRERQLKPARIVTGV